MKNRKQIWYIVSSIFFAAVLFIYATTTNYQNNSSARQTTSETYTNALPSVPIDIKYNSEKYFISGFASEVSVVLTGSNRVTLASEMQESTRKFKVVADLTKATEGTREVPLAIKNLPSGLTATVTPAKTTVKIGKKASKTFEVKTTISSAQLADGLTVDRVSIADNKVTVTSDEDTLEKVDHVEAALPTSEKISNNYTGTVPLQAVDASGTVLPSVITPYETTIKITVKSSSSSSSSTSSSK
ncbi:CdaR family protein [Streptococcus constellatus]|uniref:CdaR family protein n=1 Tax=Streptococcus constellatus TaxID=76860 RepID=UPI0012392BCD|nr:CdaR family protein [Streptococcus constellatus]